MSISAKNKLNFYCRLLLEVTNIVVDSVPLAKSGLITRKFGLLLGDKLLGPFNLSMELGGSSCLLLGLGLGSGCTNFRLGSLLAPSFGGTRSGPHDLSLGSGSSISNHENHVRLAPDRNLGAGLNLCNGHGLSLLRHERNTFSSFLVHKRDSNLHLFVGVGASTFLLGSFGFGSGHLFMKNFYVLVVFLLNKWYLVGM